eukprot:g81807.t1
MELPSALSREILRNLAHVLSIEHFTGVLLCRSKWLLLGSDSEPDSFLPNRRKLRIFFLQILQTICEFEISRRPSESK